MRKLFTEAKRKRLRKAARHYSTKPLKPHEYGDWPAFLIAPSGEVYGCEHGSHVDLEKALAKYPAAWSWGSSAIIGQGWIKVSHRGVEEPSMPTAAQNRALQRVLVARGKLGGRNYGEARGEATAYRAVGVVTVRKLFTEDRRRELRETTLRERVAHIDPFDVEPPHEAWNEAKWGKIARSMFLHDWKGHPLPALHYGGDDYRALTGSHRIEAARRTELPTIPLLVVDGPRFEAILKRELEMPKHADLEDILHRVQLASLGAMTISQIARESGLPKFAAVMKAEHE